jgi:hypothetical protein
MDYQKRDEIISKTLSSPEGQKALAKTMIEPIKKALSFQSVGRTLMQVEKFPSESKFKEINNNLNKIYKNKNVVVEKRHANINVL